MKAIFDNVAIKTSKMTTRSYSTSFSLGILLLNNSIRDAIYSIYGFVRFADEIVDTFHDYDKEKLLNEFRIDTYKAINEGISLNPILHSFQWVVNKYNIDMELIDTFLDSMEMDLQKRDYNQEEFEKYILGSAEVVGLMCLKVFCEGDKEQYDNLKAPAMKLGSAFQKINFLRDLNADYQKLGRAYFPGIDVENFDFATKKAVEADIEKDFNAGLEGIKKLPLNARFGVYIAYMYYYKLFQKIKNTPHSKIMKERIRVPNAKKYSLILSSYFRYRLNII